jgi:hypothetical protein
MDKNMVKKVLTFKAGRKILTNLLTNYFEKCII